MDITRFDVHLSCSLNVRDRQVIAISRVPQSRHHIQSKGIATQELRHLLRPTVTTHVGHNQCYNIRGNDYNLVFARLVE